MHEVRGLFSNPCLESLSQRRVEMVEILVPLLGGLRPCISEMRLILLRKPVSGLVEAEQPILMPPGLHLRQESLEVGCGAPMYVWSVVEVKDAHEGSYGKSSCAEFIGGKGGVSP